MRIRPVVPFLVLAVGLAIGLAVGARYKVPPEVLVVHDIAPAPLAPECTAIISADPDPDPDPNPTPRPPRVVVREDLATAEKMARGWRRTEDRLDAGRAIR